MSEERLPEYRCHTCLRGPDKVRFGYNHETRNKICVECERQTMVRNELAEQEAEVSRDVVNVIRATITSRRSSLPQWHDVAGKLLEKFGGTDSVVDRIYVHVSGMLEGQTSPKVKLDALKFIVSILKAGMEEQKLELEVSQMSDDQLNEGLQRFLNERFQVALPQPRLSYNADEEGNGNGEEESE